MTEPAASSPDAAAHYQNMFHNAASGLARVGVDGELIEVNDRFCEMMGHERSRLIGMSIADITHPDDLMQNLELLADARAARRRSYRMQKRYLRADGSILWADLSVAAEHDENGAIVGLISTVIDIGSTKQLEQRLKDIVGELEHRSRNLYMLMIGIINHTKAPTVEAFRHDLTQRLVSLANSQSLMVNGDQATIALDTLIHMQLGAFIAEGNPRLHIACPDFRLGAEAARLLGMALHELATNASKYGALSVDEGAVRITVRVTPTLFEFDWVESGGPTVAPPTRKGFGRTIVEQMIARGLGLDVSLSFHPEGVHWRCSGPPESLRD